MRYLGLDVGGRSIGVAVGEIMARELTTLRAPKERSFYDSPAKEEVVSKIDDIIKLEEADAIVVGLPVNESGDLTGEAAKIKQFAEYLGRHTDKKIHYTDETLTSFMAEEMLESQGLSVEEAKQKEDQLAAQLILQQFLEGNEGA